MPNNVGLQTCYWWGTKIGDDLDAIIYHTAKIGADYVELNPSSVLHLTKQERDSLKKRIQDQGLGVTVNGSMLSAAENLMSHDPAIVKAGLAKCREITELCADLGSSIWTGIMHGVWNSRPDVNNLTENIQACRKRSLLGVKEVMNIAADYDVTYCLEVVNRYEFFFLNTAADGAAYCEEINSPHCKLLLDVFHMTIEEDNTPNAILHAQKNNHIGCIHCGESNRRIPKGDPSNVDWQAVGKAIKQSGYTGPLTIESFEFSNAKNAGSVCTWRDHRNPHDFNSVEETARQGVQFLKSIVS